MLLQYTLFIEVWFTSCRGRLGLEEMRRCGPDPGGLPPTVGLSRRLLQTGLSSGQLLTEGAPVEAADHPSEEEQPPSAFDDLLVSPTWILMLQLDCRNM